MKVTFFDNGMNMAFENGEQVSVAQKSWLIVYAEYLESQGIDPAEQEYEMPNGQAVKLFKTEDGFNWQWQISIISMEITHD